MRPSSSKVYRIHHLRCGKQTETTCAAQPERSKDTSVALPAFCAESFSTSTCCRFGKEKFDSKSPVQKDRNKKHLGGWIENDKNDSKGIWIYKYIIYIYVYIFLSLSFLFSHGTDQKSSFKTSNTHPTLSSQLSSLNLCEFECAVIDQFLQSHTVPGSRSSAIQ